MMYSLLQLGQLKSCRQSRVLIESSHFSLDMHVLKGPDCPANEPAVGERALGPRASPAEGTTTARAPPSWQNSVP